MVCHYVACHNLEQSYLVEGLSPLWVNGAYRGRVQDGQRLYLIIVWVCGCLARARWLFTSAGFQDLAPTLVAT